MLDFEILFQKHKFMCILSKVSAIGVKVEQLKNYRKMTKMPKELQNQENNNKGVLFLLNLIYCYLKWQFSNLSKSGILKILLSGIKEQSTFSEQLMRVLFPELYKQI